MYKLVAIDLDGTLLDSYGKVSQENQEIIRQIEKENIKVVIASGRNKLSAMSFTKEINSNEYLICNNGATLYDIKNEKNIYNNAIDKKKALDIIKICEENSIFYSIYTDDYIIAKTLSYHVLYLANENNNTIDESRTKIKITNNIYDYINENNVNVLKMNICDDNKIIFERIINKLKEIKEVNVLDVEHMSRKVIKTGTEENTIEYFYTEITAENVDKWYAIEKLINILHLKKEEVIAIGDNVNDKNMIENAGVGVIMKNAAPYLKEFADYETESNNNSGVAKAIKNLILKNE